MCPEYCVNHVPKRTNTNSNITKSGALNSSRFAVRRREGFERGVLKGVFPLHGVTEA